MPIDSLTSSGASIGTSVEMDFPETLVRIDCRGEIRPGIATQWRRDSTGKVWVFTLGHHGPPGDSSATAPELVSLWKRREQLPGDLGIESAVAVDRYTLQVSLGLTPDSAPRLFADPALGLTRDSAGDTDPRDALDRGAALVVTRDPAVRDYVSHRPELMTFALPWSRTYVLVQPAGAESLAGALGRDSVGRSLASDVVPAEARPAEGPFWWQEREACRPEGSSSDGGPKLPRLLYRRSDRVAAALAERIVALAEKATLRAAGLSDSGFADAYRTGQHLGYVISMPRQVAAPCHHSRQLMPGATIQPLIDTRASAIVRRGSPPLTVDWDGSVHPVGMGDTTSAVP